MAITRDIFQFLDVVKRKSVLYDTWNHFKWNIKKVTRIKLPKQENHCVTRALRIRCIDSAATRTYYTLNSTSFHIYWYYWDVMWFSCVWSGNAIDMYVRIYTWHMIPRLRLTHHSDLYVVGELNMKSEFVVIVFRILNVSFNFQVSITAVNTLTQ